MKGRTFSFPKPQEEATLKEERKPKQNKKHKVHIQNNPAENNRPLSDFSKWKRLVKQLFWCYTATTAKDNNCFLCILFSSEQCSVPFPITFVMSGPVYTAAFSYPAKVATLKKNDKKICYILTFRGPLLLLLWGHNGRGLNHDNLNVLSAFNFASTIFRLLWPLKGAVSRGFCCFRSMLC